jgi:hypothetical protein
MVGQTIDLPTDCQNEGLKHQSLDCRIPVISLMSLLGRFYEAEGVDKHLGYWKSIIGHMTATLLTPIPTLY